jgi:hypothetical protein
MASPNPGSRAKYNAKKDIPVHESGGCTYHGESG